MYDGAGSADSDAATAEYYAYIGELVAQRRATPRDDFVTMLLSATVEGHRLSDHDVARFMRVLLIAGHETTAASMAYALRHLAQHPAQWDELRAAPELIPTAVEEFLRLSSTVTLQARMRRATSRSEAPRSSPATSWPCPSRRRTVIATRSRKRSSASSIGRPTATWRSASGRMSASVRTSLASSSL